MKTEETFLDFVPTFPELSLLFRLAGKSGIKPRPMEHIEYGRLLMVGMVTRSISCGTVSLTDKGHQYAERVRNGCVTVRAHFQYLRDG